MMIVVITHPGLKAGRRRTAGRQMDPESSLSGGVIVITYDFQLTCSHQCEGPLGRSVDGYLLECGGSRFDPFDRGRLYFAFSGPQVMAGQDKIKK